MSQAKLSPTSSHPLEVAQSSKEADSPTISRRTFIEGAAATLGVTIGVAVLGAGCSKESGGGSPQIATAQGNGFLLAGAIMPDAGQALIFNFPDKSPGLLFNAQNGESGAVSALCTHLQCTVQWEGTDTQTPFHCPCHQSKFTQKGQPAGGPAKAPLAFYSATTSGSDIKLTKV